MSKADSVNSILSLVSPERMFSPAVKQSVNAKEENLAEHFETPEDLDIDFEML